MSKTYQERLQDFAQALIASGRYITTFALPIFKAELDLFDEKGLNIILFELYNDNPPVALSDSEKSNINKLGKEAILANDVASVKIAKALGADLFENADVAEFLPSLAGQENTTELVKILLESGYNPNLCDGGGCLLHYAIWGGRIETVKLLVETFNARTEAIGRFPSSLVLAAEQIVTNKNLSEENREGCRKIVQFFLSKGISDYDKGWGTTISQEEFEALISAEKTALDAAASAEAGKALITSARLILNEKDKETFDDIVKEFINSGKITEALDVIAQGGSIAAAVKEAGKEKGALSFNEALIERGFNPLTNLEDQTAQTIVKEQVQNLQELSSSVEAGGEEIDASEYYQASGAAGNSGVEMAGAAALSLESDTE